ncbi:hypothetical protein COHA_008719 [Chlorella ohadii]|uniref:Uncharacterized protein n=1 Tax=Chlorella ohadii TaxID=2649997 RepID=A0AAD5DIC1_9CHLO|nr:hypothetical protein COHA_008719 [Chlorella ohadii]
MAFFQRVMNYLLNEVLVNSLANSRTFQRFAIRSSAMMQDMAKKSAEQKAQLGQTAAEKGGHFWKVFSEELTKGMKDINSKVK